MLVLAVLDVRSSQRQEGRILPTQCEVSWSCSADEHRSVEVLEDLF